LLPSKGKEKEQMQILRYLDWPLRKGLPSSRRVLTALFLLVLAASGSNRIWAAESPDQPSKQSRGSEWQLQRLNEIVNLTADQKASVQRILEEQSEKVSALRSDQSLSREDRMAKSKSIREETHEKINALLTPEQKQALEEHRKKAGEEFGARRTEFALKRLTQELNLTEAQSTAIKPILESEGEQLKALRGDETLSREQKAEKAKQIHEQAQMQIKPLLNADQQQKLAEMRQRREKGGRRGPSENL
jgi:Spy/CpxP family protein refolding chaperone